LALLPGGFSLMLLMPLVGFMLSRYDPRKMMTFGLVALCFSLFHMTNFNLGVDFRTVVYARMIQTMGLAFLFVPINTAAYAFLPKEKNNAASGLMNLARNIGGSVGISIVTTMLDRRQQYHLNRMSSHLSSANPAVQSTIQGTTQALMTRGFSATEAMHRAYAIMQANVFRQASMLAYIDNFWLLGAAIGALVPMVFLMKRPRSGGAIAVH
jgi:DHA2 family multidrug resistance protein